MWICGAAWQHLKIMIRPTSNTSLSTGSHILHTEKKVNKCSKINIFVCFLLERQKITVSPAKLVFPPQPVPVPALPVTGH